VFNEEEEKVGVLAVWGGVANDAYNITYQGGADVDRRAISGRVIPDISLGRAVAAMLLIRLLW
jgi:hypothetical protein